MIANRRDRWRVIDRGDCQDKVAARRQGPIPHRERDGRRSILVGRRRQRHRPIGSASSEHDVPVGHQCRVGGAATHRQASRGGFRIPDRKADCCARRVLVDRLIRDARERRRRVRTGADWGGQIRLDLGGAQRPIVDPHFIDLALERLPEDAVPSDLQRVRGGQNISGPCLGSHLHPVHI